MAEDIIAFQAGREAAINGSTRHARRSADWREGFDQVVRESPARTDIRTANDPTLAAIVAGEDPRGASHIMRILADREMENRRTVACLSRLTATAIILRCAFGPPYTVRFADEGRGYGVDPFDNLLDAAAAAHRWLNATAI